MKHLMFLYLTLSYSIGLPSLVILVLAFFKSRFKMLVYLFLFLFMVTLHLIYLTYVEYRYANTFYWFSNYDTLISNVLQSFLVIALPLQINEWLELPRRTRINASFAGLFLVSLFLIGIAFYRGSIGEAENGQIDLAVRGIWIAAHLYIGLILVFRFKKFKSMGDRNFALFTALFLAAEFSQQFFPIFKTFPENSVVFAAGYFFWNLGIIKYGVERFYTAPAPAPLPVASMKEAVQGLKLTEREKEILLLLVEGHSNQTIGAQLYISETTVKTHIKNIYRKLEVSNRIQLFNQLNGEKLKG